MKLILPLLWSSLVLGGPIVQPEKRQLKEILDSTGLTKVIEDMGLTEAINGLGLNTILSVLERVMPLEIPKVNSLAPKIRTTTKRSRVMWGPYDFQPTSNETKSGLFTQAAMTIGLQMDPNGVMGFKSLGGICKDCTVIHGSAYVSNEKGERMNVADGAFVHHLGILNPNKKATPFFSCGGKETTPYQHFLGSGVDDSEYFYTNVDGTYNSGFYIGPNEKFMMQYEIINYTPTPQKWYIAMDYEYMDGKPPGTEDVSINDFNTEGCYGWEGAQIKPPTGKLQFTNTSPDYVMHKDGTILYLMGHMHDGGENIELLLNDKTVCNSRATYGGRNTRQNNDGSVLESIEAMSACTQTIPIKKGDVVRLVSHYDVEKHPVRHSAGHMDNVMSVFTFVFATKNDQPS